MAADAAMAAFILAAVPQRADFGQDSTAKPCLEGLRRSAEHDPRVVFGAVAEPRSEVSSSPLALASV